MNCYKCSSPDVTDIIGGTILRPQDNRGLCAPCADVTFKPMKAGDNTLDPTVDDRLAIWVCWR